MKITHVEVFPVIVPDDPQFKWRAGLSGSAKGGQRAAIRIGTDEGVTGVALAPRPGSAPAVQDFIDRVVRDELIGKDPLLREFLWQRMWELDRIQEFPLPLLGLVDVALWDLAGRLGSQPAWQIMGGFRTKIPAYASTATFATTQEFLDVADQCLALGYRAIKLHAWGDARADAALSVALREHVGPDIELMYDGSAAFDLPDSIRLGRVLAEAGYLWYEEPMREFSVSAYSALASAVSVPLLVAETSDGAHMNSADFIKAGAATFGVRAGTGLRGGFTGSLRTAHLADAFRVRAEVHGPDLPNHHLCMAISNTTYFESFVFSNPVERDRFVDDEGYVHAPMDVGVALPHTNDYPKELAPYVEGSTMSVDSLELAGRI